MSTFESELLDATFQLELAYGFMKDISNAKQMFLLDSKDSNEADEADEVEVEEKSIDVQNLEKHLAMGMIDATIEIRPHELIFGLVTIINLLMESGGLSEDTFFKALETTIAQIRSNHGK